MKIKNGSELLKLIRENGLVGLKRAIKSNNTLVRVNRKKVCEVGKNKSGVVEKVESKYGSIKLN